MGRQPILPLNIFSPIEPESTKVDCRAYLDFLKHLETIMYNISEKSKMYIEFKNRAKQSQEPLYPNDIVFAFFNLVKNDLSKKLQSFYTGPFIVINKISDALYEIQPIGNNPVKKNQIIQRDKIRKIDSKTKVYDEIIPFNIYPVPEIVPSEEISIEMHHKTDEIKNSEDSNYFDESEFSILSYEHDYPSNDIVEEDSSEDNIDKVGGGVSFESNEKSVHFEPEPVV